jgi:hypothetical protein
MSEDGPDVTPEDALQIAQRALAKVNEQEREISDLREELTAVQLRLSEQDDDRAYESYTVDEKVGIVREYAFEKALDRGGRVTLDYDDVIYEIFDGKPSADHAYKLMRLAAEARGFEYRKSRRPKELAVNAAEAKQTAAFSSAKNSVSGRGSL